MDSIRHVTQSRKSRRRLLLGILLAIIAGVFFVVYLWARPRTIRFSRLLSWLRNPQAYPEWDVQGGTRCGAAPFLIPTDGYIGLLWDDSFRPGHHHQGIDIFSGTSAGNTPVYAVYSGYLTRLPEWKSSLIIRVPDDPLNPGRQIWTYYTHMADREGNDFIEPEFSPGTTEQYIEAGTLLGYQGDYSGNPANPVGVHLHFSIVLDDGQGSFRNELEIKNTVDPSLYLGLPLNGTQNLDQIPVCESKR